MQEWFQNFRKLRGDFPKSYVIIDTETTGVKRATDLIVQIGFAIVENQELLLAESFMLNLVDCPLVNQEWLKTSLENVAKHMKEKGGHSWEMEDLKNGRPPADVLKEIHAHLINARELGLPIVTHNGWGFDVSMLENHFRGFLDLNFKFQDNEVIDTGIIEKASQLNLYPYADESLRMFSKRIAGMMVPGVYWALDKHCIPKYGLAEKLTEMGYGVNKCHDAAVDCRVTYLLLESMRQLSEEVK